jgi:hypothetical protein
MVVEHFGHSITEEAMGVEISAGCLDVGIEYLQTMELIRFVLCRPISANLLALRELCVAAQVEICVRADWRTVNLPRCAVVAWGVVDRSSGGNAWACPWALSWPASIARPCPSIG